MSKILKEFIRLSLREATFPHIRTSMLGLKPNIDTLGIMTAENPDGKKRPPEFNNNRNKLLLQDLRSLGYGPIKIGGSFGAKENSFLIPNIKSEDLVSLGKKYGQESVIFGEKNTNQDGEIFMKWYYIEGSNIIQTRDVSLSNTMKSGEKIQDREDFYSSHKGRKFLIPFFEKDYEESR